MLENIKSAVYNGKIKSIEGIIVDALENGASAQDILDVMIETMEDVGDKFQSNEIFISEMLASALVMKKGIAFLTKDLKKDFNSDTEKYGKCIIGTVIGDLHDIGKNLVSIMMENVGFEVIDLGIDVPPQKFVEAIRDNPDCKIVGMSALLTTTVGAMRDTVKAIKDAKLKSQVKIIVGGTPVTAEFAKEIGADAYAPDAFAAAKIAKELVMGEINVPNIYNDSSIIQKDNTK